MSPSRNGPSWLIIGAVAIVCVAAAETKEDVPALVKQLSDKDALVRLRAAKVLGSLGVDAKQAIPALTDALKDDDEDVRFVAGRALVKVGGTASSLGDKAVKFCQDNLGQKVGNGQCATLAVLALKAAGGGLPPDYKDSLSTGDYVWGDLVYSVEIKDGVPLVRKQPKKDVQPGDVMQVGNVNFSGVTKEGGTYESATTHHTAVVKEVKEDGNALVVFEQNVNGKMVVMEGVYHLDDLNMGWVRVYRLLPK